MPVPLDAVTLAVEVTFDAVATAVEAAVDTVALAVQVRGQMIPAGGLGTPGGAIQMPVDAVTPAIEVAIDALALAVQAVIDPVSLEVEVIVAPISVRGRLCADGAGKQYAGAQCYDQFLMAHHHSPWHVWMVSVDGAYTPLIQYNAAPRLALTATVTKTLPGRIQ
jgi:hypothetical protein